MGANTYRLMSELTAEGEPGTDALAGLSKIVFSSTLTEPLSWPNTRLVSGDAVEAVRAGLVARQAEVGLPAAGGGETSPAQVVQDALTYLTNHGEKMRYADYRRQGLPLMSSHVESVIKQINYRVKGTEKFWSEDGAEAILQLRADYLSATEPLTASARLVMIQVAGSPPGATMTSPSIWPPLRI